MNTYIQLTFSFILSAARSQWRTEETSGNNFRVGSFPIHTTPGRAHIWAGQVCMHVCMYLKYVSAKNDMYV